jgi:hypothetical protein
MKTIMRNTLLACLLPAIASTVVAQQGSGSIKSTTNEPAAIAPMAGVSNYSYSDENYFGKNFKEEDLKSKEVSKEITAPKGADIYIENSSRGIVVKTWDQQKVKVTTTIYYEGETKLTDEEWLDKVNLSLKTLGASVKIKSGSISGGFMYYSGSGTINAAGVAVFGGNGQNLGTKANMKRVVTVTVPAGSKIDIESKYADVTLPAGIGDANVDISNGNLEADNLNKLILRSKYSNANMGDIKTAEIEFTNGRFSAKNIDDLDIDSKYSTIEMAAASKLVMRSTNDEYELEEAGEVRGRKAYGNLRITKLNGSLEMDGTNADIKVRKTGSSLSFIKIDDKYADVRIPLRETKNYSVDFTGAYSSVYGNFDKVPVSDKEKNFTNNIEKTTSTHTETEVQVAGKLSKTTTLTNSNWNEGNSPSRFTATVGDGKGLKIDIKCQNCTVDFK